MNVATIKTTPQPVKTTPEAEVRALMEDWLQAVRAGDVDRIVAHYAPDILAFDAVLQLQFKGVDAYKKHWQACLAMCPGEMVFEVHDLSVAASNDVAFCHCLSRCGVITKDGEEKTSWMRGTVGYRKTNGRWAVVHEHWSAPFDMASGKAMFDLQP